MTRTRGCSNSRSLPPPRRRSPPREAAGVALLAALLLACNEPVGHPGFASPHASPIALSPTGHELYVVNTAADSLEVIDTTSHRVARRVDTGIDPVSLAVRPDGKEVWVSDHLSDSVSVIDVDRHSRTRYQVIATITAWDPSGLVSDFDEPVGIAFANDQKAYVALSSRNRIAVVDVGSRAVMKQLQVKAQEPRAIAVRDGRLFVLPFESTNQTELSGCWTPGGPDGCTFSLGVLFDNSNDAILTRNMVADIIRRPEAPDRDLLVYDTADESPLFEVSSIGTLLYGLAIDSQGRVFIAQTEARNDANGAAGTLGDELPEMENRAFLNQVARVDCSVDCTGIEWIDLEPLPPQHPAEGAQLATPFGIQVSDDDSTVVSVAAASSRLFTLDAASGGILGTTEVGAIPRGLALESDAGGAPLRAWVYNAVENSVSVVDLSDPTAPQETARIALRDPTRPEVKRGRIAFNDAAGSTTGTFACASCHPDGNTDQLLWNLGSKCLTPGCDQAQPRTTMPVRGLRDTLPLHWDGVPGDPFGGINALLADSGLLAEPNCTDEHGCFRNLVDGAMSGTMCVPSACPTDQNELGLAGAFGEAERDAMAVFLRSVPYPPARSRRLDDQLSPLGAEGFRNFLVGIDEAHPGCSRADACHALPFWAGTNTPGTGFDAPTFRGLTDRHLLLPNGRSGMWQLIQTAQLNEVPWDPNDGPDELYSWGMTFGPVNFPFANRSSSGTGPFPLFQLFEEGSTGFSATFGKQVTLDATTTSGGASAATLALLERLEEADTDGVIDLHARGVRIPEAGRPQGMRFVYDDGMYLGVRNPVLDRMTRAELVDAARDGEVVITVTARLGANSNVEHPQPALWLPSSNPEHESARFFLAQIPELTAPPTLTVFGRHVVEGAIVLVDGRAVGGSVSCEIGGALPSCDDEQLRIDLATLPDAGDHTLQLVTPGGLLSNEVLIVVP